ncbi:MAG: type I-C CRISPR-associated endonuclease Cas1c [Firmicutes bacterium]|nr:type I-C CRISPR-associated endonuclease Cas1c [Bacillota bacterium]
MKKLLNTIYITNPKMYLSLDGENVVILLDNDVFTRVPIHNLESIVTFGYSGISPALMGKCAEYGIAVNFMTMHGRFLASVEGEASGNVHLRREQYRIADSEERSLNISKNIIAAKIYNSKWILQRTLRDHEMSIDAENVRKVSEDLTNLSQYARKCGDTDILRGIEGRAAASYFSVFDQMILRQQDDFAFNGRNRRPPLDNVNAMLSFAYALLGNMCASALSSVGLDPYVGFFHTDRPGRRSLALDLMEEFRGVMADRFVVKMINKQMISSKDFVVKENGAVIATDDGRRKILNEWQARKKEEINHPFLKEKMPWGLAPYSQALLLARYIRGDLDEYPPFMWK